MTGPGSELRSLDLRDFFCSESGEVRKEAALNYNWNARSNLGGAMVLDKPFMLAFPTEDAPPYIIIFDKEMRWQERNKYGQN